MIRSLFKPLVAAVLEWEAKLVLKKYRPKIVGVTGSVGKTSSKDAIFTALSESFFVRKSEKSFNSEIGIPLTILGQPNAWASVFGWLKNFLEGLALIVLRSHYPKWLVLEVGADRPGDIQKVAGWLSPNIVVVTRLPDVPVHVEFFDSPEAVIDEKSYLPRSLKEGGTLVLNADDEKVLKFRSIQPEATTILYGFDAGAALKASSEQIVYEKGRAVGMSFRVDYEGSSVPITLKGVLGRQHIYAVLAGLAVGVSQGLNLVSMGQAFSKHALPPGRMRVIEGINDSTIIDDTYNSSPVATEEALSVLKNMKVSGKKIVILGDMMELGSYSVDAHRAVGVQVAESADTLITVGLRSRYIAEGAHKSGMKKKQMHSYDESFQAGKEFVRHVGEGDVILIKGSQSIRLERVVEQIMANPEKKKNLLVRQDKAWEKR